MKALSPITLLVLCLFTLSQTRVQAQDREDTIKYSFAVDSMLAELDTSKNLLERYDLHYWLAEDLMSVDAHKCLYHTREAIRLARHFRDDYYLAYLINYEANCFDDLGQYEEAIDKYEEAIEVAYNAMRNIEGDSLLDYQWDLVSFYNNLGYSYYNLGQYHKAFEYYLRSLDLGKEVACPDISTTYGSIAELFLAVGDVSQARDFVRKAKSVDMDGEDILLSISVIGDIYIAEGKLDSAQQFFESMLDPGREWTTNYDRVVAYRGLGQIGISNEDPVTINKYAEACFMAARQLDNKIFQASALRQLGHAQLLAGNLTGAKEHLNKSISIAEETSSIGEMHLGYDLLADYFLRMSDFEQAYALRDRAGEIQDTLRARERANHMALTMLNRELLARDKQAAALEQRLAQDQELIRNSASFGIAMLIFGVAVALIVFLFMRFRGRPEAMNSAFIIAGGTDDRSKFLKRVCIALGLMLIPIMIHTVMWNEMSQVAVLSVVFPWLAVIFLFAHYQRLSVAVVILIVGGYSAMALVPLYFGPLHTIVLTIAAAYIIVAYSSESQRIQLLNACAAVGAFLTYSLILPNAIPVTNANPEGLELMIGLLSLGTIFVGLYFYHGQLNQYRLDLQRTNSFLKKISNLNPHFIFAKDVNRQFTFINKAMIEDFGSSYSGMLGRRSEDILDILREDENFRSDEADVLEFGETKHRIEERFVTHDGTEKWLETVKRPIEDETGEITGLLGVATDITARRESEQKLQISLSQLSATLDSTADGLLVVDLNSHIVQYNRKFLEMWNFDGASFSLSDSKALEIVSQQLVDPSQFVNRVQEIYDNPELETFDTLHFIDGRIYERYSQAQKIDSEVVGRVWSFRDVTDKTVTTSNLKESEEKYRYIFENADQGIVLYDVDLQHPIDCNSKSLEIFGCQSKEELMLHPLSDFARPVQKNDVPYEQYAAEKMNELVTFEKSKYEMLGRTISGEPFVGEITAIKNFSDEQKLIWYFISDITESTEARTSLERSESRYRMILEDNLFPIFTVRNGRLQHANNALAQMLGYSDLELMELGIARVIHKDDLSDYMKLADVLRSGKHSKGNLNTRYVRKDGSIGYLIASVKAYHDSEGNYVESIITAADITQLKNVEFALAESEEQYRVLFDQYPIGIVVVDADFSKKGLACNDKMGELLEASQEQVLNGNILLFSPEKQPDGQNSALKFDGLMEAYRLAGEPIRFEWKFKKGNGQFFLADVIYSPVHILGQRLNMILIQDITMLKKAEQNLRQSESRYRSLVEASPDGIIMTDVNGNLTYASQRMLEIVGFEDARFLLGKNLIDFAATEEVNRARADLGRVLTSGSEVFTRYRIKRRHGDYLPIELGSQRIVDSRGRTTGIICIVRDISEQYESERILRESEERYRLLFENTFDGFMVLDGKGAIQDCNNSAVDLLSYPDVHLLQNKSLTELFPELMERPDYNSILNGKLKKSQSLRLVGHDFFGMDIFVEVSFCQIPVDGDRKIACAIRNVAEKVIVERQEKEIESQQFEVDALNREIASHTLFNSQKNKLLSEIKDEIEAVAQHGDNKLQKALDKVNRKIDANLNESEDIVAFKMQFEKIHPNFFKRLHEIGGSLTNNDLKYCAYIRLNMTTQDICNLLYIEKKSVEMAKYRIKKKLGLGKAERLNELIHSI